MTEGTSPLPIQMTANKKKMQNPYHDYFFLFDDINSFSNTS